jgi:WD40-like Beta Propeller Repeat
MTTALHRTALLGALCGACVGAAASCGSIDSSTFMTSTTSGAGGAPATSGGINEAGAGGLSLATGTGGESASLVAFPEAPLLDPSAPASAPALFGPAGSGDPSGGPCLFEPEPGTLFPSNWLRPRFRFNAGANQNLFELRLHTSDEAHDLVVYTALTTWTMPRAMWQSLAQHATNGPITMTVRGAHYNGSTLDGAPSVGTSGPMTIAPAPASGAIVYWTTSSGSALKGFKIGEETVGPTLTPEQAKMPTVGGPVKCIGCHTSTPDGLYAAFTAQSPWGNAFASIEQGQVGAQPSFLSAGALAAFTSLGELGIQTFSKAHWKSGDQMMLSPFGSAQASRLAWFDLQAQGSGEGQAYGFLKRDGDSRGAGAPTWSHDGKTVVYVSTNAELTGRLDAGDADLYAVPYNDRQGGAATPIPGAADPELEEYYPAFSPDDSLLAFNRIPKATSMYNAAQAEVYVIPSAGGAATRIVANDPAACSGVVSPGVTNSWPKWAPEGTTVGAKTYNWLIFSSTRGPKKNPQLYIAGVVTEDGKVTTSAALYLWNQPENENNHTPAWDIFKIPPSPPAQ